MVDTNYGQIRALLILVYPRSLQQYPEHFEWIASIHPYRRDCVDELEKAVDARHEGLNGCRPVWA